MLTISANLLLNPPKASPPGAPAEPENGFAAALQQLQGREAPVEGRQAVPVSLPLSKPEAGEGAEPIILPETTASAPIEPALAPLVLVPDSGSSTTVLPEEPREDEAFDEAPPLSASPAAPWSPPSIPASPPPGPEASASEVRRQPVDFPGGGRLEVSSGRDGSPVQVAAGGTPVEAVRTRPVESASGTPEIVGKGKDLFLAHASPGAGTVSEPGEPPAFAPPRAEIARSELPARVIPDPLPAANPEVAAFGSGVHAVPGDAPVLPPPGADSAPKTPVLTPLPPTVVPAAAAAEVAPIGAAPPEKPDAAAGKPSESVSDRRFAELLDPPAEKVEFVPTKPVESLGAPAGGGEDTPRAQPELQPVRGAADPEGTATGGIVSPPPSPLSDLSANREGTEPVLQLPSGARVPERAIVEQVFARLAPAAPAASTPGKLTLRLHPEELGQITIDLALGKEGVTAHLQAQNQQVQEVLEKQLPRLRETLQEQGVRVDDLRVGVGTEGGRDDLPRHRQPSFIPSTRSFPSALAEGSLPTTPRTRLSAASRLSIRI